MASDHTRSAILAAAERPFTADRGFGDVDAARQIVAEANVNLAAVNYHFGSKDETDRGAVRHPQHRRQSRGRLNELRGGGGKNGRAAAPASIRFSRALVGPARCAGCLGLDREKLGRGRAS